ncbi:MAG: cobalt-precorrin-5B (C(1))-methyltransferase [Ardenticatenia bacterium]|nr:cobalt-precorrin-5B (C(1))-methyltransferase [Ardenticatenia bacterium]
MARYSVPPRNKRGSRTGYTTGTNAAAAAKAATLALLTGAWPDEVVVTLPIGETTVMKPVECREGDGWTFCCMVKDAGDDPDVTHGALICARVCLADAPGIQLKGGEGVGVVTRPGLGLPVGEPAMNPVPRRQIQENVLEAVRTVHPEGEQFLEHQGLEVTISVPDGETLAQKTLNPRLGIVGGISILGTTGKVYPYSTAAWRASVIQAVEVAARNGFDHLVLTTGGRSEQFAMRLFPHLPELAFVQMSVFTGDALKACLRERVPRVTLVGMIGKLIKTAQGHLTTHVAGNQVDFTFLANVCREVGAPADFVNAVAKANTGRHVLELCQAVGFMAPIVRVVELAANTCADFVAERGGTMRLDLVLVDFDGTPLARACRRVTARRLPPPPDGRALVERLASGEEHVEEHT